MQNHYKNAALIKTKSNHKHLSFQILMQLINIIWLWE